MQLQIVQDLLDEGVPPRHIIRVPLDQVTATEDMLDPILRITAWIEHNITPATFNALAHQGQPAYLFFDEVQRIHNWNEQLKFLVDHSAVEVVATGSSALRIERGGHQMAGRMSTVEAGTLSLTEIADFQGIHPLITSRTKQALGNSAGWSSGKNWPNADGETRQLATRPSACSRNAAATRLPMTHSKRPPIGQPSPIA